MKDFDVKHFAKLARLSLSDEKVETLHQEMNDILELVSQLEELDLTDVKPTSYAIDMVNVMREDTHKDSLPREKVLANFPDTEDEIYLRSPVMIEGHES